MENKLNISLKSKSKQGYPLNWPNSIYEGVFESNKFKFMI